jgi:Caspase domain
MHLEVTKKNHVTMRLKTGFTWLLSIVLGCSGYAQKNNYPKVSDDANIVLELSSNVSETKFIVDGKEIIVGERVRVLINKKDHIVEAIPKGYISKKDYLQPPYMDKYATLRFTFLLEDRVREEVVTNIAPVLPKNEKAEQPKTDQLNATALGLSASGYSNRYALIIGNSAYVESPLRNPANDAKVIAKELQNLKFEVMAYVNLDKSKMKEVIRAFEDKISKNKGVALFYYAGHGLQSNGTNYLVPINAKIQREYDIEDECIKADMVLRMLEINENPMNIVILDACRNNPFASSTRSLSRGLAQPENAPKGSIIAFATAPGKTASDGDGDNGLYTQELIKALRKPGLSVEQVFKEVRVNVIKQSNNAQMPWENSSLLGDFFFHN